MEGANGQHYIESPLQEAISLPPGLEITSVDKVKQPLPSTNMFRVVSDPSSLTITKVQPAAVDHGKRKLNHSIAGLLESPSLTITKVNKPDNSEFRIVNSSESAPEDAYLISNPFVNGENSSNSDNTNPGEISDEIRAYECDECGKAFKRSDHLKKHKVTHSGIKPWECDICGKKYTQSGTLKMHRATHTQEDLVACALFQAYGVRNTTLPQTENCSLCNKNFPNLQALQTHQKTHAASFKLFTCDVCGKKFTQKGNLNTHKMIHDNIRPYKCAVCSKEFVQKNNYLLHMKTHEKHSTSGHIVNIPTPQIRKPVPNNMTCFMDENVDSYNEMEEEEDDGYLDDLVVGTIGITENAEIITSTPVKEEPQDTEEPGASKSSKDGEGSRKKRKHKSREEKANSRAVKTNSSPFVCMDCNNKPFSDKCKENNHKMYVLF